MKLLQVRFIGRLLLEIRFIRILLGAILGAFLATLILFLIDEKSIGSISIFYFWLASSGYMLVYGVTASYALDRTTHFLSGWKRSALAAIFHIGGAILFLGHIASFAYIYTACFWIVDEWLRYKYQKPSEPKLDLSHESIKEV